MALISAQQGCEESGTVLGWPRAISRRQECAQALHSALTGLHLWRRYPWQTEERLAAEAALRAMGVVPAAAPSDSSVQQPSE